MKLDNLGIPPLAGVCTYQEAAAIGYDVDRNVMLLKRYNYVLVCLHRTVSAHLARTPEWEVKCGLSLHLWLDAEHCAAIRNRVSEMREPPLRLDQAPDPKLEAFGEELIRAEGTAELLTGIYEVARPALIAAMRRHLEETNPLSDYVTRRMLKSMLGEQEEMEEWGGLALGALTGNERDAAQAESWRRHLLGFLEAAGGLGGEAPIPGRVPGEAEAEPALPKEQDGDRTPPSTMFRPRWDGGSYEMDAAPRRDDRFVDPHNHAAKIDDYFCDESYRPDERAAALLFKRVREMDVPEWMAPIIFKTKGKSWDYYREMSRQLWDEARHAMMGEAGLAAMGIPFYQYPISMNVSTLLNESFEPLEAHLVLWTIEQNLMKKETGKPFEWAVAAGSGNALAKLYHDYDWADEVLHAQIGRRWLQSEFPDLAAMKARGDELLKRWWSMEATVAGRSKQINWWPEFVEGRRLGNGGDTMKAR
jgi:hypothetical protein